MATTYNAGIVTAYGAAVRGGYTGTYEDFCRQQAGYAQSAAAVEQAKEDVQELVDNIPADYSQLSEDVSTLKEDIENIEAIPHSVKLAMDTLFSKAAYADADAGSSYATFHAWATANPVTSITAVFTQGSVTIFDNDSLDTLQQYLVVTATYSDSTTTTVTDYTLSGTLTAGTSVITVSYGGKTDTFKVTVTGLVLPSGYTRHGYIKKKTTASLSVNSNGWISLNNQQNLDALSMKLTISQETNAPSNDQSVIGVRSEVSYLTSFSVYRRKNSGNIFGVVHGTEWDSNVVLTNNTPNTIEIINTVSSPSSYKVNDASGEINWDSLVNIPYGLVLFTNPQHGTTGNMYIAQSIRIGDIILRKTDGECVGYYVPAVYNDVIGMYDFISAQFYSTPTASYATISNSNCAYSVGDW